MNTKTDSPVDAPRSGAIRAAITHLQVDALTVASTLPSRADGTPCPNGLPKCHPTGVLRNQARYNGATAADKRGPSPRSRSQSQQPASKLRGPALGCTIDSEGLRRGAREKKSDRLRHATRRPTVFPAGVAPGTAPFRPWHRGPVERFTCWACSDKFPGKDTPCGRCRTVPGDALQRGHALRSVPNSARGGFRFGGNRCGGGEH